MSLIAEAPKILGPSKIARWVTLLDADETLDNCPEVRWCIKHVDENQLLRLAQQVGAKRRQGRSDALAVNLNEERAYRRAFCRLAVVDWQGMTKNNYRRLSEYYLAHPELLGDVPGEVEFNTDDLDKIAETMSGLADQPFAILQAEVLDYQRFATEALQREKKDSNSSSASSSASSPPSSVAATTLTR